MNTELTRRELIEENTQVDRNLRISERSPRDAERIEVAGVQGLPPRCAAAYCNLGPKVDIYLTERGQGTHAMQGNPPRIDDHARFFQRLAGSRLLQRLAFFEITRGWRP
jgi:hypothetical protein